MRDASRRHSVVTTECRRDASRHQGRSAGTLWHASASAEEQRLLEAHGEHDAPAVRRLPRRADGAAPSHTGPQPACRLVSASSLEGLLTRHFTGVRREAAALGDHSAARPGRMNEGGIAQTEQRAPLLHPPSSGKQHGMQGRSVRASAARPLHHPAARRPARATEADFGQLCWLGTAKREVPPR